MWEPGNEKREEEGDQGGEEEGLEARLADHLNIRRLGDLQNVEAHESADDKADQRPEQGGDHQVHRHIADAFAGAEAVDAHDGEL